MYVLVVYTRNGIELEMEMWLKTDASQNSIREWRRVECELREAQTESKSNLVEKSHQDSYHRQITNRESYVWLSEGTLRSLTDTLILTAQFKMMCCTQGGTKTGILAS